MTEENKKAIEILESSNKILEDKLRILKKANKELTDQLNLCSVNQKRELLIDCVDHCYSVDNYKFRTTEDKVDNYLDSL